MICMRLMLLIGLASVGDFRGGVHGDSLPLIGFFLRDR